MSLEITKEVFEAQKRSVNVIIHGDKESLSTKVKERIKSDTEKIDDLFTLLSINLDKIVNILRLDRP